MEEYFLFILGGIWILFATIQDLKMREVANWLSFSLIAFVLAYRAFYSVLNNDVYYFIYGVLGVLFYTIFAFAFYYGKVFAGGDAKLLIGVGGILPYGSFFDIFLFGVGFILLLFLIGAVYSLVYSAFLVYKKREKFYPAFVEELKKGKLLFIFSFILIVILAFLSDFAYIWVIGSLLILFVPLLYSYLQAFDSSCMFKLVKTKDLTEGDWIENEIKIGGKIIKPSVHGLSRDEIRFLRKYDKKILIKDGVPFVPAFLISFIMLFFLILSGFDLSWIFSLEIN